MKHECIHAGDMAVNRKMIEVEYKKSLDKSLHIGDSCRRAAATVEYGCSFNRKTDN